jgi:hypothetical protein
MNILIFTIVGSLAAGLGSAPHSADPDCSRYLEAMKSPEAVAVLEAWRTRLPEIFDKKKYPRVLESSGFGAYSIALDFDPATVGLGAAAHAEISADPNNRKIRFAAITDALRTGFVFKFEGYEYRFEGAAMKTPRTHHIGVACTTERSGD